MWIAIALTLTAALAGMMLWLKRTPPQTPADAATNGESPVAADAAGDASAHETERTQAVADEIYKIAFAVHRCDYQIFDEHVRVLARVEQAAASAIEERDYFPRRPLLLPKLLRAINDDESTRTELVRLILEDPTLAGAVLQRANSAFYRMTPNPVESLHRAVVLLGIEGLRGLVATAILQPVFRLPKGQFDNFAPVTWDQGLRSSVAAESCARMGSGADPFIAQLLGLMGALARIVLFRLTADKYREEANILPRPEVFVRVMQSQGRRVAQLIAKRWELSDPSIAALDEQTKAVAPAAMSPLGRALYFGELCGTVSLLVARQRYSASDALELLIAQGLDKDAAEAAWQAASRVED